MTPLQKANAFSLLEKELQVQQQLEKLYFNQESDIGQNQSQSQIKLNVYNYDSLNQDDTLLNQQLTNYFENQMQQQSKISSEEEKKDEQSEFNYNFKPIFLHAHQYHYHQQTHPQYLNRNQMSQNPYQQTYWPHQSYSQAQNFSAYQNQQPFQNYQQVSSLEKANQWYEHQRKDKLVDDKFKYKKFQRKLSKLLKSKKYKKLRYICHTEIHRDMLEKAFNQFKSIFPVNNIIFNEEKQQIRTIAIGDTKLITVFIFENQKQ
ncbi:UNKNOWN [Stylonychia lemnae]|uniref:Uncharacterized protein n=1 Tax=Stylonychia lemnae TaxID=5949 RepID=A0A078AIL5_STYLE|nr:UNKNOWN [Stylonychia lemnae]|eukprot:CDW80653.1 UNKNOWN [Stylonychia lemnae]